MHLLWLRIPALALGRLLILGLSLTASAADAGALCPPLSVLEGDEVPYDDCRPNVQQTQRFGVAATRVFIAPGCTDPAIRAVPQKLHMVIVPEDVSRPQLWLHFGGTGTGAVSGNPSNSQNIGTAAASLGYRFISLAYPNRRSIADRCFCEGLGPRVPTCAGHVRAELLYGVNLTADFHMVPSESIVHRLRALLRWLIDHDPGSGWDAFLDLDQEPVWPLIAVSGFSQGGGMAGMLARDKPLHRVLYLSKGADAVASVELDPGNAQACGSHDECSSRHCCSLANPGCQLPPASGGICMVPVPAPWANEGRDLDGDGVGEGDQGSRAVPPDRQFGIVHRCEEAWLNSPQVFAHWGLGQPERFRAAMPDFPATATGRLFSTDLRPPSNCSAHQSVAVDACQPTLATGLPAMWETWRLLMASEWLQGDDFETPLPPQAPPGCPVP